MSGNKNRFFVSSGRFARIDEHSGFEGYMREVSKGLRALYWSLPTGTVLHRVSQADSEFSEWRIERNAGSRRIERRSEAGELFRIDVDKCEGLRLFIANQCKWDANADYGPGLLIVVDPMDETLWAVTDGENDETPGAAEARIWGWGFSKPEIGDLYQRIEHVSRRPEPERRADEIEHYLSTKGVTLSAATLRGTRGRTGGLRADARRHFLRIGGDWTSDKFEKAWDVLRNRYPE